MSKYTTEVRFICENAYGLKESAGVTSVDTILSEVAPKIFNFDFPIFDEEYRKTLEIKILKHYYTREIGEETVGLWKLRLNTKLNEIMPYYNKLYTSELLEFNPLYTHNITHNHERTVNTDTDRTSNANSSGNSTTTSSDKTVDKYSDTPQGSLTNLEADTYLTNARIDEGSATDSTTSSTSNSSKDTGNIDTTEKYLETVAGYEGSDPSKLLLDYRKTFLNIDLMVIEELDNLFIQLW